MVKHLKILIPNMWILGYLSAYLNTTITYTEDISGGFIISRLGHAIDRIRDLFKNYCIRQI